MRPEEAKKIQKEGSGTFGYFEDRRYRWRKVGVPSTKIRPRLTVSMGTETVSLQPHNPSFASDNKLEKVGD